MKLFIALAGTLAMSTASAQLDVSGPLVGDRFDPYVTSDEIRVRELPPEVVKPEIGDHYNPYVTYDEIVIAENVRTVVQPSVGDQYDPYTAAADPETELAQFEAVEPGRITIEMDTTFGFDEAELTDRGKERLDQIVQRAEQVGDARIEISGYTDHIGPPSYNRDLSQRRAEAVKDYLVSEGISEEMITARGYGEENPVVQCEGLSGDQLIECLAPNRRAEVEFAAVETEEVSPQGATIY